ncbi:hypothetical protein IFM89_029936 [Coptis chinensis]|uniref:Uncharacterized protein n=1 Tax=Coptis chinensis TaxID=261450 RepID=A0A835HGK6_9MAGN|nr:hypothetical protein IFM89_029936 [Coptis chinensis]
MVALCICRHHNSSMTHKCKNTSSIVPSNSGAAALIHCKEVHLHRSWEQFVQQNFNWMHRKFHRTAGGYMVSPKKGILWGSLERVATKRVRSFENLLDGYNSSPTFDVHRDECLKELEVPLLMENDKNVEKAEAYTKELEDLLLRSPPEAYKKWSRQEYWERFVQSRISDEFQSLHSVPSSMKNLTTHELRWTSDTVYGNGSYSNSLSATSTNHDGNGTDTPMSSKPSTMKRTSSSKLLHFSQELKAEAITKAKQFSQELKAEFQRKFSRNHSTASKALSRSSSSLNHNQNGDHHFDSAFIC